MGSVFPSHSPAQQKIDDAARKADVLQRVIASINSGLALEPLLTNILDSSIALIKATHGTIGLVVERSEGQAIRTVAMHNMPAEEIGAEMSSGIGLAGYVLKTGKTVRLDRYGDLEQPTLPELANHSVIGVPIRWGDKMIGFFGLGNESPNRFNERDAETLELFAQYAAVAINNANLFEASRSALDEMRLLYKTSRRMGLSAGVEEVIDAYLDQVAAGGKYVCNIVLYDFDPQGQRVSVIVRGRWSPQSGSLRLDERLPYSRDDLDPLLDAGQTVTISDVRTDPRVSTILREMQEKEGRLALAMIPLMVRDQRIGLVVLSYAGVHTWIESQLRPYRATAAQLAIAIDHWRQQTLLKYRDEQFAVMEERHRLARELHDSVTQLIFSTTLIAQSIAPAWKRDPNEGQKRVDRLLELSQTALREMRALLFELRPSEESYPKETPAALTGLERIRHFGLFEALRLLAEDVSHDGIVATLNVAGDAKSLWEGETGRSAEEAALAEGMYRIVQESLNNATKHARASRIRIHIQMDAPNALLLSVVDNGVGFDSNSLQNGFGMQTMRERTESLGGKLRVDSQPGAGTTIEVKIPLKETRV